MVVARVGIGHQQQILPTIVVEIEHRAARAERVEDREGAGQRGPAVVHSPVARDVVEHLRTLAGADWPVTPHRLRAWFATHMLDGEGFESCVEAMRSSPLSDAELLGFYTGDVAILAVCAAEALARRPIDREIRDRVLQSLNDVSPYEIGRAHV